MNKSNNVCQKAAYNSRSQFRIEETGHLTKKNWTKDAEHWVAGDITLPVGVPAKYKDRALLWNELNNLEKQYNGQVARNWELNLPNELNEIEATKLAQEMALKLSSEGMVVDWNIHWKENNHHVHLLTTMRKYENGKWGNKAQDQFQCINKETGEIKHFSKVSEILPGFERQPLLDENGNQKVRVRKGKGSEKLWIKEKVDLTGWSDKDKLIQWRHDWQDLGNKYLNKYKSEWSCETLKKQYLDNGVPEEYIPEPQIHLGIKASAIENQEKERCSSAGIEYKPITERGKINKEIIEHNGLILAFIELTEKLNELKEKGIDKYKQFINNFGKASKDNSYVANRASRNTTRTFTKEQPKSRETFTYRPDNRTNKERVFERVRNSQNRTTARRSQKGKER